MTLLTPVLVADAQALELARPGERELHTPAPLPSPEP